MSSAATCNGSAAIGLHRSIAYQPVHVARSADLSIAIGMDVRRWCRSISVASTLGTGSEARMIATDSTRVIMVPLFCARVHRFAVVSSHFQRSSLGVYA